MGQIRHAQKKVNLLLRLIDLALIVGTYRLCVYSYDDRWDDYHYIFSLIAGLFYLLFGEAAGVYRSWRAVGHWRWIGRIFTTWFVTWAPVLLFAFSTKTTHILSRLSCGFWLILTPLALCLWHQLRTSVLRRVRARGMNTRRAAILGLTPTGFEICREIRQNPWIGFTIHGFYDDRSPPRVKPMPWPEVPIIGQIADLIRAAQRGEIDHAFIALPMAAEERIRSIVDALSDTTISLYVIPDSFLFELMNARWAEVGEIPAISVFETPFYSVDGFVKRLEDLLLCALILPLILLPMGIIALLIKLTSRGPVLFKQSRYGLNGEEISVWKFRSMNASAPTEEFRQAIPNDPRVTRLGALLRRTSLDELPQFFNVLQGHMSVIGPRPHASVQNEMYRKLIRGYMMRHKVRPGITGWAQVNGLRGETRELEQMRQRVAYDHYYIRNWSVLLDLEIILRTLIILVTGKNAY